MLKMVLKIKLTALKKTLFSQFHLKVIGNININSITKLLLEINCETHLHLSILTVVLTASLILLIKQ